MTLAADVIVAPRTTLTIRAGARVIFQEGVAAAPRGRWGKTGEALIGGRESPAPRGSSQRRRGSRHGGGSGTALAKAGLRRDYLRRPRPLERPPGPIRGEHGLRRAVRRTLSTASLNDCLFSGAGGAVFLRGFGRAAARRCRCDGSGRFGCWAGDDLGAARSPAASSRAGVRADGGGTWRGSSCARRPLPGKPPRSRRLRRRAPARGAMNAPQSLRLCIMTTGSMRPAIDIGDFIMIEEAVPGRFEPGDIVLLPDAAGAGASAVHRVVELRKSSGERWLVTKGDACVLADEPVREAAVAGRAALLGRTGARWVRLDLPAVRWSGRAAAAAFIWTSAAAETRAGRRLERMIAAVIGLAWAEPGLRFLYDATLRRRWLWARGLRARPRDERRDRSASGGSSTARSTPRRGHQPALAAARSPGDCASRGLPAPGASRPDRSMIRIGREGVKGTATPAELSRLRERFARRHFIRLPGFLEPELIALVQGKLKDARFKREVAETASTCARSRRTPRRESFSGCFSTTAGCTNSSRP